MNFLICLSIPRSRKVTTCLNKPVLVVCDIDGTLTHDGCINPSEYTLDTIRKLHDHGIGFAVASGRSDDQLLEMYESWKLGFDIDLIIGGNGSEYYDGNKKKNNILYLLSEDDIKEIITSMLERYPDLNCSIYKDGMRYLRYEDTMAVQSKKRNKMNNKIVEDVSEMWKDPCYKVMFRVTEDVMEIIEPYANSLTNERYRSCKTQTTMMEFVHSRADKGNALKIYCLNNNINLDNVWAFGDLTNDNELLITAGHGVCMINGTDDTKKCADAITEFDNNHDGFAHYIEDRLFKNFF